jgi:hypothetical protein
LVFLLGVLDPVDGPSAAFAAVYLTLLCAACVGPFLHPRDLAVFGASALVVVLGTTLAAQGPWLSAIAAALYVTLFAATAAAIGRSIYRPAVCVLALLLLTTFFYWDDALLFDAADRRQSAAWAFAINPAAAASLTLGFDWMHAKALYSSSQTAESMFGVPMSGLGAMTAKTLAVFVPFAGLAWWRERRT